MDHHIRTLGLSVTAGRASPGMDHAVRCNLRGSNSECVITLQELVHNLKEYENLKVNFRVEKRGVTLMEPHLLQSEVRVVTGRNG